MHAHALMGGLICLGEGAWVHNLPAFSGVSLEAIERLRYRAEDVARLLNPTAVREVCMGFHCLIFEISSQSFCALWVLSATCTLY